LLIRMVIPVIMENPAMAQLLRLRHFRLKRLSLQKDKAIGKGNSIKDNYAEIKDGDSDNVI